MPYVLLDGIKTYYEVHGEGEPLLVLHGGLDSIETLAPQAEGLARRFRLYLPERRGHGRTPDVPGDLTYQAMTDDTTAFMDAVGLDSAHVLGWSDGAIVAIHLAIQRPGLVRRVVLVSANFHVDGMQPWFRRWCESVTVERFSPRLRADYDRLSPDGPAHFATVLEKAVAMWLREPTFTVEDLARIRAPTLVMAADNDINAPEHTLALQRAIPGAQLCILPGTTHDLLSEKPDLANRIILEFLTAS